MNALARGLVALTAVLMLLVPATAARADPLRLQVIYTRPAASCAPHVLPWRTGPVLVSPIRQAYRAGYHEGYADGFRAGVAAPMAVRRTVIPYSRRTVIPYRPVPSYGLMRYGTVRGSHGLSSGTIISIRW